MNPPAPQAIILAAGMGRRMRPFSDAAHKALLPIAGTTILARIVDALLGIGVETFTVVVGYRAGEVRSYLLEHYPTSDFRFVENDRFEETNNIVSLWLALDRFDGASDVILVECDILFEPRLLERLAGPGRGNVALVDRYRPGMDGTVVSVRDGLVSAVFPPHLQGEDFSFTDKYKTLNIYRFGRDFCTTTLRPLLDVYANKIDSTAYYELVLCALANLPAQQIAAENVEGSRWAEVDDPVDLASARFIFEPDSRAELLDRGLGGTWNLELTDFAFMRNAHFPTESMLAAMRHALPRLLATYGSSQEVLNEKTSWFLGCDPGRIEVLHGASQAFPILSELLEGRRVAHPAPTFGEYRRAFPGSATYADAPGVDPAEMERLASEVDVLVVVNPNSPTGTTLRTAAIHELARRHPGTLLLVDESFIAFSGEPSLVALLETEPLENIVVLHSLSKALGVPGLRLGYLYSSDAKFLGAFARRLPIWNLSSLAEFFLELLLKFRNELAESIERTVAERESLRGDLLGIPTVESVAPSGANFLLLELKGDPGLARMARLRLLAGHAIDVKDVSERFPDGRGRLRVAVRDQPDNGRLVAALTQVLDAGS